MLKQEGYWTYRASTDTPELHDLPPGAVAPNTTEKQWNSLSPGMRREIYRQATKEGRSGLTP